MVGQDDAGTAAAGPAGAAALPNFADMIARHRQGIGFARGLAIGLALVGLALVAFATAAPPGLRLPALVVGALALALCILPLREAQERRERIEGLEVLADEWSTAGPAERDRLVALLTRLYR